MFLAKRSWFDFLRKLRASEQGGVIIYLAFMLPMLMGAMALSVDLGRSFILNTELKDFSDAAALAGAFELDKTDGAMARAEDAARTGLKGTLVNVQAFATDGGGPSITVDKVVFLRNLPADGTNFTAADTATSDADAGFIFVSVVNRSVRSGLSRALGVIPDFNTIARSIAGRGSILCEVPAMFMCNPLEDPDFPTPPGVACIKGEKARLIGQEACLQGRLMQLRQGGSNKSKDPDNPNKSQDKNSYFPGEFGLLECPGYGKGAEETFKCIAEARPPICISQRAYVKTGVVAMKVANAINLRLDLYGPGVKNSYKNDFNFRPALNVTKGHEFTGKANDCSVLPDEGSVEADLVAKYPRDSCFATGTCAGGGRWGDGDWQDDGRFAEYWSINHGNSAFSTPPAGSGDWTRYDVYRHEINSELNLEPGPGIPTLAPDGGPTLEKGKACNYKAGNDFYPFDGFSDPSLNEDDLDRRLLTLSVVNCMEHGPLTGASSNNKGGVEIEGFVEVFLTEPAGLPSEKTKEDKKDIWGEVARIVDQDDRMKVIVQLYR